MTHEKMQEYNKDLIDRKIDTSIADYISVVSTTVFNIDTAFMKDFMDLVTRDDCCVPHEYLFKYGVLSEHDSSHVKRLLDQHEFIEEKDYTLISPKDGGNPKSGRPSSTYWLTPTALKFILMRSQKQKKVCGLLLIIRKVCQVLQ